MTAQSFPGLTRVAKTELGREIAPGDEFTRAVRYGALPGRIPSEAVWRGEYRFRAGAPSNGWLPVCNTNQQHIAYTSAHAAIAAAKHVRELRMKAEAEFTS